MAWFERLITHAAELVVSGLPVVLAGDYNVVPTVQDIYPTRSLDNNAFDPTFWNMAAKNRSPLIYPFLYTLAWTGMRSDEARTLRWSQVDFEGGEVVVGKSKTEAGKGRRIPMSASLKAVLSTHASACAAKLGELHPDWFVFPLSNRLPFKDPTKPVTTMKTAWEPVREAAKVDGRLHDPSLVLHETGGSGRAGKYDA